ncbi:hypothetical protein [Stutzerimonas urumqiensis]|uniref:hypothetical protein n=1 Tax=Stutzerimonas urumqiensis TaxID=638269 RepID=UPI001FE8ABCE|nr:hypothetical protein [Stutzerimonas urumqiensis]
MRQGVATAPHPGHFAAAPLHERTVGFSLSRATLFLLILVNSTVFFLTDDKLAGLPFARELFLLAVVAVTGLLFVTWREIYFSKTSLWIMFMGIVLPLGSAGLANLNFGQPLPFGLLEERRMVMYLVFFPMLLLLFTAQPTERDLERYFLIAGVICGLVGFGYYFEIIPENGNISFDKDQVEMGANLLRPDRFRIGSGYVSLCAVILLYRMRDRVSLNDLLLLLFFTAYLWFVMQTRQTMAGWALAGLWIFRNRIDSLFKVGVLAGGLLGVAYLIFPAFFHDQYEKLVLLYEEALTGGDVRGQTIDIIVREVADNWYVGMGALSQQWNGGFSALYNPHFFLSDVGIFGVYYRFGALTPLIAAVFYLGFFWIMAQTKRKGHLLSAFQLKFWITFMSLVLSNAMTFGGDMLGMTAAIFLYFAHVEAQEKDVSQTLGWANHDSVQYRHHQLEQS